MHSLRMCCKILCQNLVVNPKCTLGGSTKFHPFHEGGGLVEFDAEFKFAKIQNSYVGGGGGLTEFDAEFKFAKIQNSYVDGGGGGSRNLMLRSNLLKSKIPISMSPPPPLHPRTNFQLVFDHRR